MSFCVDLISLRGCEFLQAERKLKISYNIHFGFHLAYDFNNIAIRPFRVGVKNNTSHCMHNISLM